MYYQRRPYVMSSRVTVLRVLGVIHILLAILIFLLGVAMTSIDVHEHEHATLSMQIKFFAVPVVTLAIGAGVSASILSRYEGVVYNLPARHLLLALSSMNGVISLMFCLFAGEIMFELVDAKLLTNAYTNGENAIVAIMIAIEAVVFLNMLVAFICVAFAGFWNPPINQDSPLPPMERPVIIEEKPYSRGYSDTRNDYSDSARYYSRSRALPALKYY